MQYAAARAAHPARCLVYMYWSIQYFRDISPREPCGWIPLPLPAFAARLWLLSCMGVRLTHTVGLGSRLAGRCAAVWLCERTAGATPALTGR